MAAIDKCELCSRDHAVEVKSRGSGEQVMLLCGKCAVAADLYIECSECGTQVGDDNFDDTFAAPHCRDCVTKEVKRVRRAYPYD